MHELDYVRQGREIAQLQIGIARDVVSLADGGEHLRLLDGIDAEVGFQVEVQVQHVFGIAGLFDHQVQDAFLRSGRRPLRSRCATGAGSGRRRRYCFSRQIGPAVD